MVSRFGWIDFSEEDRRKMLEVIKLLSQQDTVDELGIGTVRDAFANYFFPGTSTIQTRAKYFLFMPWIYKKIESRIERISLDPNEITRRVTEQEKQLIYALLNGGETEGVIGRFKREKLHRFPSSIYWAGLGTFGIRRFDGSQKDFHRYLKDLYRTPSPVLKGNDNRSKEYEELGAEGTKPTWNPALPTSPEDFLKVSNFKLTLKEAEFFRERIIQSNRRSLLAEFLLDPQESLEVAFIWQHPLIAKLEAGMQEIVGHARIFSETVHGAALLYNLMLSEKRNFEERISEYREKIDEWGLKMQPRWKDLEAWGMKKELFWKNPALHKRPVPTKTKNFVNSWLEIVLAKSNVDSLAGSKTARDLISFREKQMKGKRARLQNDEALSGWQGASGTAQLDFRWGNAKWILSDIYEGLQLKEN